MWKIQVILLLYYFIRLGESDTSVVPICPKDQRFVQCKGCQKTCYNMYLYLDKCTEECESGCVCNHGLVKSSTGKCILPSACPLSEIKCSAKQVYTPCGAGCMRTCENMLQTISCPGICKPGCVCKEGYFMNKKGYCVSQAQCLSEEVICPPDRIYSACGAGWPSTCANAFANRPQRLPCRPGCICKPPLVQNNAGNCIHPSNCPPTEVVCPPTKIFTSCAAHCPITCRNMYDHHPCPEICVPGCICRPGEVPNSQDICVAPVQCLPPEITCPPDTVYSPCGAMCIRTCDNLNQRLFCPAKCTPGCVCRPGLVLKDKQCILPSQCPPRGLRCPPTQMYTPCDAECTKTCWNMYMNFRCPKICKPGCTCLPGMVKNKKGICVWPKDCPVNEILCPKDRIFSKPGLYACPKTCENVFLKKPHPRACSAGCICAPPLVETKLGTCVNPPACPPEEVKCPPTTVFSPCGAGCITTCANMYTKRVCAEGCIPGCICKKGEVMDKNGRCILPSQCPIEEICCPKNKVYTSCGSGCPITCKNMNLPIICPRVCKPGCLCKDGLVENKNGVCVAPSECRPEEIVCPENQVYTSCGAACPVTCENVNLKRVCPKICKAGCICCEGYVINKYGKCVKPESCPPSVQTKVITKYIKHEEIKPPIKCPHDQVYTPCGANCRKTCSNCYLNQPCTKECVPGCVCKDNEVLTDEGKCVPPESCPETEVRCPKTMIYDRCRKCRKTCDGEVCTELCKCGCYCPKNLVYDSYTKTCVEKYECSNSNPNKECRAKDPNSEYRLCGSTCPKRCPGCEESPCLGHCVTGCFCKKGYLLNAKGKCVRPSDCPPVHT